ncbi:MAG TPA: M56 family metallopeptidase [Acidobacteriaceae bacterium]|jgi:TonB family protein|nr:M56 family metallopeptidase [Acidobacteriaceae bacterium]
MILNHAPLPATAPLVTFTLTYLLNALWQVPLVFAAATLAARALRRFGPAAEHRLWVATLILQTLLPACSFPLLDWARALSAFLLGFLGAPAPHTSAGITVTLGPAYAHGLLRLPPALLPALAAAYFLLLTLAAARLARGLVHTHRLRLRARPAILPSALSLVWSRCARTFDVPDALLAVSSEILGPSTLGIRRRTVLLPSAWLHTLSEEDLATALAHEFAHMRRHDFAKNLALQLLSLPIAFHPVFRLTTARLAGTREMLCDELAAHALRGRDPYVRSLLRLASAVLADAPAPTLHAIGIFDANILERRVMNLTHKRLELHGIRRIVTLSAVAVLALGTCASALALRLEIAAPASATPAAPQTANTRTRVSGGVMAGQILNRVNPVYPESAKAAGISGTVVLDATIGFDGTIQALQIVSGPDELAAAAVEAVRQWTYKPYVLNGQPVEVQTTITVNFSLGQ